MFEKLGGMSRMNRVRNEEVRMRVEIERELASRAGQRVLRCFGHGERMDEQHGQKGDDGGSKWRRVRGRPRFSWMDV